MKRARLVATIEALLGLALMAFATQTTNESVSKSAHKAEVAHWLETTLWIEPRFMAMGAATVLTVAVLWLFITRRSAWDILIAVALFLASVGGFFLTWATTQHTNLTRSFPQ
jgi:formate-dependent nitrite reductase membrane component NrfD